MRAPAAQVKALSQMLARDAVRKQSRAEAHGTMVKRWLACAAHRADGRIAEVVAEAAWAEVARVHPHVETLCSFAGAHARRAALGEGEVSEAGWVCAHRREARSLVRHVALLQPLPAEERRELVRGRAVLAGCHVLGRPACVRGHAPLRRCGRTACSSASVCGACACRGTLSASMPQVSFVAPRLYGLLGNVLWQAGAAMALAWDLDAMRLHGRCALPSHPASRTEPGGGR